MLAAAATWERDLVGLTVAAAVTIWIAIAALVRVTRMAIPGKTALDVTAEDTPAPAAT